MGAKKIPPLYGGTFLQEVLYFYYFVGVAVAAVAVAVVGVAAAGSVVAGAVVELAASVVFVAVPVAPSPPHAAKAAIAKIANTFFIFKVLSLVKNYVGEDIG
jgi:hypothetical protein